MQIAQGTENTEETPVQKPKVSTEAPPTNDATQATESSLRSKRYRLVSEQKKTVEGDFRFWSRVKWNENQKVKEGGGGGEGRKEGMNKLCGCFSHYCITVEPPQMFPH